MKNLIRFAFLLTLLSILSACSLFGGQNTVEQIQAPTPTKQVIVVEKLPTATNFPKIGTATPAPPTATPTVTPTPPTSDALFDDATLEDLIAGTINSAGVDASVRILDERANGGERVGEVTIVTNYALDESDLLLKLFVLEVGNALRSVRAFSQGAMSADLDSVYVIVIDNEGSTLGTVYATMDDINGFLAGGFSVNEALARLSVTGVFESFIEE